jgi:hypothetical protein
LYIPVSALPRGAPFTLPRGPPFSVLYCVECLRVAFQAGTADADATEDGGDVAKISARKGKTPAQAVAEVYAEDGVKGFWRGAGLSSSYILLLL